MGSGRPTTPFAPPRHARWGQESARDEQGRRGRQFGPVPWDLRPVAPATDLALVGAGTLWYAIDAASLLTDPECTAKKWPWTCAVTRLTRHPRWMSATATRMSPRPRIGSIAAATWAQMPRTARHQPGKDCLVRRLAPNVPVERTDHPVQIRRRCRTARWRRTRRHHPHGGIGGRFLAHVPRRRVRALPGDDDAVAASLAATAMASAGLAASLVTALLPVPRISRIVLAPVSVASYHPRVRGFIEARLGAEVSDLVLTGTQVTAQVLVGAPMGVLVTAASHAMATAEAVDGRRARRRIATRAADSDHEDSSLPCPGTPATRSARSGSRADEIAVDLGLGAAAILGVMSSPLTAAEAIGWPHRSRPGRCGSRSARRWAVVCTLGARW